MATLGTAQRSLVSQKGSWNHLNTLGACRSDNVLFYSIRPSAGPATPLTGASVDDGLPIQTGDEELLGQIDGVESGEVTGWACLRGYMQKPLQVRPMASFLQQHETQSYPHCRCQTRAV